MRFIFAQLGFAVAAALFTCKAKADLVGTTVTGQLFTSIGAPPIGNLFDPALGGIGGGLVPPGYLNSSGPTVTISASQVYDSAFQGLSFEVSSDTFPTGTFIEHDMPGRIRIGIPDFGTGGSYTAVYTLVPVPDPSPLALLTVAASVTLFARWRGESPSRRARQ